MDKRFQITQNGIITHYPVSKEELQEWGWKMDYGSQTIAKVKRPAFMKWITEAKPGESFTVFINNRWHWHAKATETIFTCLPEPIEAEWEL